MVAAFQRNSASDGPRLAHLSPVDGTWDEHKAYSIEVAQLYALGGDEFDGHAVRMRWCSRLLTFKAGVEGDKITLKLTSAEFCRVRYCPTCMWRRSLKYYALFNQALPRLRERFPDKRWLFLTLTCRNVPITELRQQITDLGRSFTRLTQRDVWPAVGWLKTVEVTRAADDQAHPHIHCLLMVNRSYWSGKSYVSHERWTDEWRDSMRVAYRPIVDIRTVKGDLDGGVREVLKYECKPADLSRMTDGPEPWLLELHRQTHKTRSLAVGGALRGFLKLHEEEDEDCEILEGDGVSGDQLDLQFLWSGTERAYRLHDPAA